MPIVNLEMILDFKKHVQGLNLPGTLENAVHLYGIYTILDPLEKALKAASATEQKEEQEA